MNNTHGLDVRYFREKLTLIARDCDHFTPYEMYLALTRLADVVQESQKQEPAQAERRVNP